MALALKVLVIVVVAVLTIVGALAYGILDGMGRKPSRRRYAKR